MSDLVARLRIEATAQLAPVAAAEKAVEDLGAAAGGAKVQLDQAAQGSANLQRQTAGTAGQVQKTTQELAGLGKGAGSAKVALEAVAGGAGALEKTAGTAIAAVGGTTKALAAVEGQSKLTRGQMQELVGVARHSFDALAAGSPPLTILTTHIATVGQALSSGPGGLSGGLAAVAGLINPVVIGIGALAVAAGLGAKAANDEEVATAKLAIAATYLGGAVGVTGAQLDEYAQAGAKAGDLSVSAARDVAASYLTIDRVGGATLSALLALTKDYAAVTGQDAPAAGKKLATSLADPKRAVDQLNESLSLFNDTETQHIKKLVEAGEKQEAQREIVEALGEKIKGAADQTSGWADIFDRLGKAASDAYTAVGRVIDRALFGGSTQDQIKAVQDRIAGLQASGGAGHTTFGASEGGFANTPELGQLQGQLAALYKKAADDNLKAASTGLQDFKNDQSRIFGDALRAADPKAAKRTDIQARLSSFDSDAAQLVLSPEDRARGKAATQKQLAELDKKRGAGGRKANPDASAGKTDDNLQLEIKGETERTQAILAGAAAVDQAKIAEAGRQAVEHTGLLSRPKLTEAEKALAGSIREHAEELEALKISNDRLAKAEQLEDSFHRQTTALGEEAAAYAKGQDAVDAYQVKQAGLQALQQLGVGSLDELTKFTNAQTGAARKAADQALAHAKAVVGDAEATERQAQATEAAKRAFATEDQLDKQIAAETAKTAAIIGGTAAQVAYNQREAERQALEQAGRGITEADRQAIIRKADALVRVKAANDEAQLEKSATEEARQAALTTSEREAEVRALQIKQNLMAAIVGLTDQEAEARARVMSAQIQQDQENAAAIGRLKDDLRNGFITDGKIAFDKIGDYASQTLRKAVYDALLAKPIDIVVQATVQIEQQVIGSLLGGTGGASGLLGGLGSVLGLGSSSGGALSLGIVQGLRSTLPSLLQKAGLGVGSSIGAANLLAPALAGAGSGFLVSGVAGALGVKQTAGSQIGSTLGGIAGSFLPIPGGSFIGAAAGDLLGSLFGGGKPTNAAAVATLDPTGALTGIGGGKRTDATTQAATQAAQAIQQLEAQLTAAGAKLGATVSSIDIGVRDTTHVILSNGQRLETAVGDVNAAVTAASKALVDNADFGSDAANAYAHKMLDAGATLDQVTQTLAGAKTLGQQVDDAILQLTDPAAYQKKSALDAVEASYTALKTQAQQLVDAGLASADVLGKIDQLHTLEVADALSKLAGAAGDAASAIDPSKGATFLSDLQDKILAFNDPTAAARSSALHAIDANIADLHDQAQALVDAGELTADVFDQLDRLKDLQVDDALKQLAAAADEASAALEQQKVQAAGLAKSVAEGLLKYSDPAAYARDQATGPVDQSYEDLKAQAQAAIKAGLLDSSILGQIEQLHTEQLNEALDTLAGAVGKTTNAFQDAKSDLQSFLDKEALGPSAELSPQAARAEALKQYQRELKLAQGGDADALKAITGAADTLLQADREATSSAKDRLALYSQVTGQVRDLIARADLGPLTTTTTVVGGLGGGSTAADASSLAPPTSVSVDWMDYGKLYGDRTIAAAERSAARLDELLLKLPQLGALITGGFAALGDRLNADLFGLGGLINAETAAIAELAGQSAVTNTYLRKVVSS